MTYCRKGPDSDIYLVASGRGWDCIGCSLLECDGADTTLKDRGTLLIHLAKHILAGDIIPKRVFDRIEQEQLADA